MSYFITLFKLLKTHQIERITPNGYEMLVGQVSSYQGVNPSILMNDPHTFPVTDVNTPVNTYCQTLGKCQPGLGSRASISTPGHRKYFEKIFLTRAILPVLTARDTPLPRPCHHLIVVCRIFHVVKLQNSPNLSRGISNQFMTINTFE